jgi:hypothetical protein
MSARSIQPSKTSNSIYFLYGGIEKPATELLRNSRVQKAGLQGLATTSLKSRARGNQVMGTLAARTLMREA